MRFQKWGELVGLPSGREFCEPTIPYNTHLDRAEVRPHIERALENIRLLLRKISDIDSKYGIQANPSTEEAGSTLRGTAIFQKPFDRLKNRIRKSGTERSTLSATKWALHDGTKFKDGIVQLTAFVDALVQVTTLLGLLEERYEVLQLHAEINSITDERDLELLVTASSKHTTTSVHSTVSDTASRRLRSVASMTDGEKRAQRNSNVTPSSLSTRTRSIVRSVPSERPLQNQFSTALEPVTEENTKVFIGGDGSTKYDRRHNNSNKRFSHRPCLVCRDTLTPCFTSDNAIACFNCVKFQKQCSFDPTGKDELMDLEVANSAALQEIPQQERLLREAARRAKKEPKPLTFEAGDAEHGRRLNSIKKTDLEYWVENAADMVMQAYTGTSATKRMFYELRVIREGHVPFISASPFADNLGKILASIEGPPETPYEGGIFWIKVLVCQKSPGPPSIHFHTKIYHPNIHPTTGALCADYQQKWNPAKLPKSIKGHFEEPSALWSQRVSPNMWSLSALLIAICGLLASPNITDPLVPEIAQKYIEDPEGYNLAAKIWTERYAIITEKPKECDISFPEECNSPMVDTKLVPEEGSTGRCVSRNAKDLEQVQNMLRQKYDEKLVGKNVAVFSALCDSPKNPVSRRPCEKYLADTFDPHGSEKHLRSIKDSLTAPAPARNTPMEKLEQIYLFGQVFTLDFIGRRLGDWAVCHYHRNSPAASKADELHQLTTRLAFKIRRAGQKLEFLTTVQDREISERFIESGSCLLERFRNIFKMVEGPVAALCTDIDMAVGSRLGLFFAHAIFGSKSHFEIVDKLSVSIQLWHSSFDKNCSETMENDLEYTPILGGSRSNNRVLKDKRVSFRHIHLGLSKLKPIDEAAYSMGEDRQAISFDGRASRRDKGKGVESVDSSS